MWCLINEHMNVLSEAAENQGEFLMGNLHMYQSDTLAVQLQQGLRTRKELIACLHKQTVASSPKTSRACF